MNKLIRYILFFLVLLSLKSKIYSQVNNLQALDNEQLEKKIDNLHNEPKKAWDLIKFYIKKSKKENNKEAARIY